MLLNDPLIYWLGLWGLLAWSVYGWLASLFQERSPEEWKRLGEPRVFTRNSWSYYQLHWYGVSGGFLRLEDTGLRRLFHWVRPILAVNLLLLISPAILLVLFVVARYLP